MVAGRWRLVLLAAQGLVTAFILPRYHLKILKLMPATRAGTQLYRRGQVIRSVSRDMPNLLRGEA
jgi:hypothetical protein